MSDQSDGVRYTSKEMFERIEKLLNGFDVKLDAVSLQIQTERTLIDARFTKIEQRMPMIEDLIAEFGSFRKTFIGFEQRFSLHEAAPTHPSAAQQMTAMAFDVEQLKLGAQVQKRLDDYIKEVRQQTMEANDREANSARWRIGLAVSLALSLSIQLARVLGWVP